jgi:hypothetical protein
LPTPTNQFQLISDGSLIRRGFRAFSSRRNMVSDRGSFPYFMAAVPTPLSWSMVADTPWKYFKPGNQVLARGQNILHGGVRCARVVVRFGAWGINRIYFFFVCYPVARPVVALPQEAPLPQGLSQHH